MIISLENENRLNLHSTEENNNAMISNIKIQTEMNVVPNENEIIVNQAEKNNSAKNNMHIRIAYFINQLIEIESGKNPIVYIQEFKKQRNN